MYVINYFTFLCITIEYFKQTSTSSAISLKTHPRNTLVVAGKTSQLDCVFNSNVSSCFWNKDDMSIGINNRYQFINGGNATFIGDCSLRITAAQLKLDDGIWNCGTTQTSEKAGVQSQKAQFTVLMTPKEPVILLNGMQQDNESSVPLDLSNLSKITCMSENGNPPANLSWQLDNSIIAGSSTLYDTTDDKIKRVELNITQGMEDSWKEQKLKCISKHPSYAPNEQHYTYVTLKIPYATTTVTASSANGTTDTTIKVDNQVWIGLNCRADGFPEPSYRWDRRTDEYSPWQLYKNERNISFQAFSAQFQCVASNNNASEEIRSREIFNLITSPIGSAKNRLIVIVITVLVVFLITGIYYLYKKKQCFLSGVLQQQEQNIQEMGFSGVFVENPVYLKNTPNQSEPNEDRTRKLDKTTVFNAVAAKSGNEGLIESRISPNSEMRAKPVKPIRASVRSQSKHRLPTLKENEQNDDEQ